MRKTGRLPPPRRAGTGERRSAWLPTASTSTRSSSPRCARARDGRSAPASPTRPVRWRSMPARLAEAVAGEPADAVLAVHAAGLRAVGVSPDLLLVQEDASVLLLDPGFGAAQASNWPRSGVAPASLACAAPETIRSRHG